MPKPLLWLSVTHPGRRHAGNQVYSGGLLDAVCATGQPVTLLTQDTGPAIAGLTVTTVTPPPARPRSLGLASTLPASVWQLAHKAMRRRLAGLLAEGPWRAVVIDQAASGWAVAEVIRSGWPLIYVAHNHEASVRREVAMAEPLAWRRAVLRFDAAKYARLEQRLVREAGLITVITDADAARFSRQAPLVSILPLPPGYSGERVANRSLGQATPRRVVVVGRFEWVAKQLNLIRWAEQAVPHLAAAGIETQVVGTVPPNLRARIARPGLSFTGPVPDVAPYLANARFGLVAEDVGGGFKLKTLDYIFHRLPVAALDGNLAGQPQGVLDNALSAPTPRALADAIGSSIDDLERLNQMQHNAFRAAEPAFDWAERARRFLHALDTLNPKD